MEYRLRRYDGEYRWILDNGVPRLNEDGSFAGYIGSCTDVTERRVATEAAYRATRQTRLEHLVALIASSTTVREALQHSLDATCETLAFPVGHALVIYDDEPELAKPAHILYCKDMKRFAKLFEVSQVTSFDPQLGAPGEVLRSGKPVIHDMHPKYTDPKMYPRTAATLEAGLKAGIHLPVLVENKVEAILEFGSDYPMASNQELVDTCWLFVTGSSIF